MVEEAQFESIFTELQKIQKLEQADVQLRDIVKQQNDNLEEVKTKLGLDEDDDKSNVVGGDDAPSRLTSNERSRYKNIGKAFIEGAGQAFKKIQKAIKFKENMSTIKEKFFGGIDKIKSSVKNAFGTGRFWKNLMKIVGLLSVIIYLYREKISKNFPNLTQGVRDLFGGLKDFFGGLVVNIFEFVSTGITQSFNKLFSNALIYIPKIIDTFFGYTLPTAITNLYLEVLSLYGSESAQQQLDKRINGSIESVVQNVENNIPEVPYDDYDRDFLRVQKLFAEHPYEEGVGAVGKQDEYQELSDNAGIMAFLEQNNATLNNNYKIITETIKQNLNNYSFDIGEMMKRNQIDMSVFASQIKKFNEDKKLTKGELLSAVQNSITDTIFANTFKESFDEVLEDSAKKKALDETITDQEKSAFAAFIDAYTKNKINYSKAAEKSRELQNKYELELENQKKKFEPIVIEITSKNVGDIISDSLLKETSEVITSITNFIKGDTLKNAIKDGFIKLGDFYNNFFNKSIDLLNNALTIGSTALQQIIDKQENIRLNIQQTDAKELEQNPQQTTSNNISYGNNNVIVNVSLGNGNDNVVATLIGQLNEKDITVADEIQTSNQQLEKLLGLVKGINSITGVTEKQVNDKCDELNQKIEALKKSTSTITTQTIQQITNMGNVLYDALNTNTPFINNVTLQVTGLS